MREKARRLQPLQRSPRQPLPTPPGAPESLWRPAMTVKTPVVTPVVARGMRRLVALLVLGMLAPASECLAQSARDAAVSPEAVQPAPDGTPDLSREPAANRSPETGKNGVPSAPSLEPDPLAEWVQDKDTAQPIKKSRGYATFEEDVRRIVRERHKALQRCYRRELREDPAQYGEVVVTFTLAENGTTTATEVTYATLSSPMMEPCILKSFEGLVLPGPPRAGYRVSMPLVFTSQRTAPEIVDALKRRYRLEDPVQASKPKKAAPRADQDPW